MIKRTRKNPIKRIVKNPFKYNTSLIKSNQFQSNHDDFILNNLLGSISKSNKKLILSNQRNMVYWFETTGLNIFDIHLKKVSIY